MGKDLISVPVDELQEAEQALKKFVAESFLHYLSACEETMSRKYKITKRDKKAIFDEVQKEGKPQKEIDKENLENLIKRIHLSTEQICDYIADPEDFKESFGYINNGQYEPIMEAEAEKEAFLGLLRSSMSGSPEDWEKDFASLPENKDTATYTAEELIEAEEGLISSIEELFNDEALENLEELREEYRPDEATMAQLEKYASDAFLEGLEIDEFEDRLSELTFDDLKQTQIKVGVKDVLSYIKDTEAIEENYMSFIPQDYMTAYVRKDYILSYFSDMYEDDLNDTEE